ncbi:3'-5' exoribonuclease 1-like [Anneissia japonica]|uniref:3'-5' exoribonuclease 1-like n=1 Tax=Anneissia japonica TaxID=1529436 RepID=UPI001425A82C|nr:3'-5' exoribonuclease 1-like [Anneissia japonica]
MQILICVALSLLIICGLLFIGSKMTSEDTLDNQADDLQRLSLDERPAVYGNETVRKRFANFKNTKENTQAQTNKLPSKSSGNKFSQIDRSHPVFKQISLKNGEINKMSRGEIVAQLESAKLNTRGTSDILKSRLKSYYKRQHLGEAGFTSMQKVDYLLVIDFEATCEEPTPIDFIPEIIEFPIVLVNTSTLEVEGEFQSFCRPIVNPKLSNFCTELTSITQSMVDQADEFPEVWKRACHWMESKGLGTYHTFAVACDGPWDMNLFLNVQCHLSQIPFPKYCRRWVNVCKAMSNFYRLPRMNLKKMLNAHQLMFEGRPHRGISDAKNIARIAIILMEDGCILDSNDTFDPKFSTNMRY